MCVNNWIELVSDESGIRNGQERLETRDVKKSVELCGQETNFFQIQKPGLLS